MCFSFIGMGIRAVRQILGCICCMVLLGPILLIVGIVMLVSPNNYAAMVQQYNQGWTTFSASGGDMSILQGMQAQATLTGGTQVWFYPQNQTSTTLTGTGVTAGIQSVPLVAGSFSNSYSYGVQLFSGGSYGSGAGATVNAGILNMPSYGNYAKQHSFDARCTSSSSSSSSSSVNYCSYSSMQSYCYNHAPSGCGGYVTYSPYSGTCSTSSSSTICGTCTYYTVTTSLCYVLTRSPSTNTWSRSTAKSTCLYSSGSWNQQPSMCTGSTSGTSVLPVSFYSDQDPYIVAQSITQGSMSFGLTEAQQRGIGLALMAIGAAITACIVTVIVVVVKKVCGDPEQKTVVYGAFGQSYQPPPQAAYQPEYQATPAYNAAAPYGQAPYKQQPYEQTPPPGYGQPQPGYGQPQPGYGQPQPYQQY